MIGWLDLSSGVSGDMLLGALVDAGVPLALLQTELDRFGLPISLEAERVTRGGLAATHVNVIAAEPTPVHRRLADVRELLARLSEPVAGAAGRTFELLARAEAKVHGIGIDEVHFHEVGALDALADVAGVCAGFLSLQLTALTAGPIALGGESVASAHGRLPVPGPAVVELLRGSGAVVSGGDAGASTAHELCTPTGAALVVALATDFGPLPAVQISESGSGAGTRETPGRANIATLVLGEPAQGTAASTLIIAANVDDLDPRAWPHVLEALLAAGADDAWLTPILMKKGRPAHTVSALVTRERASAIRAVLFRETTTLGVREITATKTVLAREFQAVDVDGHIIAVKLGRDANGELLNAMPEWDDVVRAAAALGQPVKQVLARAQAAFERLDDAGS
jgi:uncharacterized protein (TIGR00299 family) protein